MYPDTKGQRALRDAITSLQWAEEFLRSGQGSVMAVDMEHFVKATRKALEARKAERLAERIAERAPGRVP